MSAAEVTPGMVQTVLQGMTTHMQDSLAAYSSTLLAALPHLQRMELMVGPEPELPPLTPLGLAVQRAARTRSQAERRGLGGFRARRYYTVGAFRELEDIVARLDHVLAGEPHSSDRQPVPLDPRVKSDLLLQLWALQERILLYNDGGTGKL